ncbi:hypothetical protein [Geitlerinema sp. PCC 9228]|jgi:hypothetical protein|uniref:hypothetical protein n=1 Tax=Geitlerinema sp. PCC 9228 TaxID=111611 RepID=UPI0008F98FBD|nr:hypothetical protein [Geitlerinema sp. PCC 9228]
MKPTTLELLPSRSPLDSKRISILPDFSMGGEQVQTAAGNRHSSLSRENQEILVILVGKLP